MKKKDNMRATSSGTAAVKCPFFDEIEDILGNDPSVVPLAIKRRLEYPVVSKLGTRARNSEFRWTQEISFISFSFTFSRVLLMLGISLVIIFFIYVSYLYVLPLFLHVFFFYSVHVSLNVIAALFPFFLFLLLVLLFMLYLLSVELLLFCVLIT